MKIIVSSTGKDIKDNIDARFGRCPYFLAVNVDKEKKEIQNFKAIKNTAAEQFGGAGITAAQLVADDKPEVIITTNMGPKAFQALDQLGVDIYQGSGNIENVINKFMVDKLKKIPKATGPMFKGKN